MIADYTAEPDWHDTLETVAANLEARHGFKAAWGQRFVTLTGKRSVMVYRRGKDGRATDGPTVFTTEEWAELKELAKPLHVCAVCHLSPELRDAEHDFDLLDGVHESCRNGWDEARGYRG